MHEKLEFQVYCVAYYVPVHGGTLVILGCDYCVAKSSCDPSSV